MSKEQRRAGGKAARPIRAYILINTEIGRARNVVNEIRGFKEVRQVHIVTGTYDAIAYVQVPTVEDLFDLVINRIQKVKGSPPAVKKTETAIADMP